MKSIPVSLSGFRLLVLLIVTFGLISHTSALFSNFGFTKNQNSLPIANPDFYTVHGSMDTLLDNKPGVLANDSDPDGDIFNAVYQPFSTSLGSGVIWDNGRVQFNSVSPYVGTVVIPYQVCDGLGCSSSTVTLNLVNQSPVANSDSYTVHSDFDTYSSQLPGILANDSDPDGDGLNITTAGNFTTSIGTGYIYPNGRVQFTPTYAQTGITSVSYTICDNYEKCSQSTISFNVVNQNPTAVSDYYLVDGDFDTNQNQRPGVLANDTDPEGDTLSVLNGGYYVTPLGNAYIYQNGRVQFSRSSNQGGTAIVSYGICDHLGKCSNGNVVFLVKPQDGADNAGETCPMQSVGKAVQSVGEPVNVTNGNMWLEQTDYNLPGIGENIEVKRFYNSIIQTSGLFGLGWSTKYDESIQIYDSKMIRLNTPDGRAVYFGRENTTSPFIAVTPDFYGQIALNADNTYTLTFKDGRIHKFSSSGKLLWQKDRNNNQTTLNYNTNGYLSGITDTFGRTLTVSTSSGYVTQISDSIGTAATYEYFPNTALLKTVTYNDGSKYKFEYTTIGGNTYLATVKDALDNILETHLYDSWGRATTSEKHGGVEKYTLDYSNAAYTQVTDANQEVTKYYFNKSKVRNVITKTEGACSCGSGSQVTTFEYDFKLNMTKKTDGNGHITTNTYDANGNKLTATDATGTKTFTYNSFGQVLTATDQLSGVTTVTYNSNGSPTQLIDALNKTTTFTYNTLGQLQTVTNARNKTTTFTWTGANLTKQTDANSKETNFVYDNRGRLQTVTNALGFVTTYEYDLNNRIKKIIYPDTKFEEFTYDLAGRRTQAKDARGNITTFGYDNAYRLTSITDALNHATTFSYDLMSNRTSLTDALNQTTNYEYDDFNRLKKVIYPPAITGGTRLEEIIEYDLVGNVKKRKDTALRETLYDYDDANRLIKTTDALNKITLFEYNNRSQMTKVKDALNQEYVFAYDALGRQLSQTRAGTTMTYEYDAVGNRTKRTDYTGRVTDYVYDDLNRLTNINYQGSTNSAVYGYDDLSRLTSAANDAGTVSFTYDNRNRIKTSTDVFAHTIEYVYDENGNRNLLKLDGAAHTGYIYDAANRLTTLTDEANHNFTFAYDNANRLTTKTLPNNVATSYDYDGMSRLKELKHQYQTTPLFDNQYAYNPANQISQITELAETRNFDYDNLDRLTGAAYANSSQTNESYAFDAVGNRNSSHLSSSYDYVANNKIILTDNSTEYEYDTNGNMTANTPPFRGSNSWTYEWDYENRMISATGTRRGARNLIITETVLYDYDALGRRIKRTDPTGSDTKFTYDGMDVLMDDDTDSGITKYQNGLGIDNKLELTNGGISSYFLSDHLGSTVALTDSTGSVSSSASYDSFGNSTNDLATRYQYTGREFDSFTGLHYYRARWYDPNLGRFISEDPIGFVDGVNLFAYVKNNPLFYKDPMGHNSCVASWAAAGSVAGAVIGGGVGLVGVVGGGVAVVVTEPAGLALGAAGGGLIGAAVGSLFCDPIPFAQYPPSPTTSPKSEEKCDTKPKSNPPPNPAPAPLPLPTPSGNRGRWTCAAKCHVNNFSNIPNAPEFCYGQGMGASERDACQAAKDVAQASSPRGTYARHCRCTQCRQQ
jgi:RHS repeat-associated protein